MNRRSFIKRASGLLVAAPAIVHASNIMPVRALPDDGWGIGLLQRYQQELLAEMAYKRQPDHDEWAVSYSYGFDVYVSSGEFLRTK